MLKKMMALVMVFVMILGTTVSVSADSLISDSKEEGIVVSERTYYDQDLDVDITEVIKFYPDDDSTYQPGTRNISGSGTFEKSDTFHWSSADMTYYVRAYFVWNDDDDYIRAYNETGGVNSVPNVTVTNAHTSKEYGQYLFWNKYVDVSYSFTATSFIGMSHDLSVTLRVSQEGVIS